jgi:hypothetical protein
MGSMGPQRALESRDCGRSWSLATAGVISLFDAGTPGEGSLSCQTGFGSAGIVYMGTCMAGSLPLGGQEQGCLWLGLLGPVRLKRCQGSTWIHIYICIHVF